VWEKSKFSLRSFESISLITYLEELDEERCMVYATALLMIEIMEIHLDRSMRDLDYLGNGHLVAAERGLLIDAVSTPWMTYTENGRLA
jgi:hypothetical protein